MVELKKIDNICNESHTKNLVDECIKDYSLESILPFEFSVLILGENFV